MDTIYEDAELYNSLMDENTKLKSKLRVAAGLIATGKQYLSGSKEEIELLRSVINERKCDIVYLEVDVENLTNELSEVRTELEDAKEENCLLNNEWYEKRGGLIVYEKMIDKLLEKL